MTRVAFINQYSPLVKSLSEATHIFPEIVFAQAIIESSGGGGDFGKNANAAKANNYFGIKASAGWQGDTFTNPDVHSESNVFRAYASPADSIKDYFRFLVSNKRYAKAGVFSAETWQEQAKALASAGYAGKGQEDNYVKLISSVAGGVQKVLGKLVDVVSKHKTGSGIAVAGIAAAAFALYLYGRK